MTVDDFPSKLSMIQSESSLILKDLEGLEREWVLRLGVIESQIQAYESHDLPAYQTWLRLEFGPLLSAMEESHSRIRQHHLMATRVREWVERGSLAPREALYLALHPDEADRYWTKKGLGTGQVQAEVDARRKAKKEAKRELRREKKKSAVEPVKLDESRKSRIKIYRELARKLHPDSHAQLKSPQTGALWLEVQAAYQSGDDARLISIASWIATGFGVGRVGTSGPYSRTPQEIERRIAQLEKTFRKLSRTLESLQDSPAWKFSDVRASSDGRIKKLKSRVTMELEREWERAQVSEQSYEEFFDSLGSPKAPKAMR